MTTHAPSKETVPTLEIIRKETEKQLGRYPCLWQAQVTQALLQGNKDVVVKSGTGSGKTLTFWMPLLFSRTSIQVVITPLNLLGLQNEKELVGRGIRAISISGDTATHENIQVGHSTIYVTRRA